MRLGSAAYKAGLTPGQKILAVNGRAFSHDVFNDAVKAAKGTTDPITLTVQDDDTVVPMMLQYNDGLRYPRLARVDGVADTLTEITTPLTTAAPTLIH